MQHTLIIVGVIALVLFIGAVKERRRHAMLQTWIQSHAEARLYRGFVPEQCAGFPAVQLAAEVLGRDPSRWAAAVETPKVCFGELSISRSAGETSKWYVLVAQRTATGEWEARIVNGLITKDLLDSCSA